MASDLETPSQELQNLDRDCPPENAIPQVEVRQLPPVDGGWNAWVFIFGCFMIETVLWGFPFSFGVLREYYTTHPPISKDPAGISAVGTTCSGIMYLGAPFMFAALQRSTHLLRTSLFYGLPLVVLGVALSSLATKVWHLLLTQGILYAIGGNLMYSVIFIYIDEWFVRRKGLALGIMWAGSGIGGLTGPLVLNWGLARYGPKTFLQGWAIALIILVGPLLFFIRPRVPPSRSQSPPMLTGFGFVKTRTFWFLQIGNIIQGLGYFIPALYLPAYGHGQDLSTIHSSLLVSILNTFSAPGVLFLSYLCDKYPVYNIILVSSVGSCLSVLLLWGLSGSSFAVLVLFACAYGFFAGGWTATYAGTAAELRRVTPGGEDMANIGSIFGLISAGRGIGNVVCGPVSEGLLSFHSWNGGSLGGYATGFGPLIVFTGCTSGLAVIGWLGKKFKTT